MGLDQADTYRRGILWGTSKQDRSYFVLPQVLGLDGVWRNILREVLGDFPQPPASGDQTVPPSPRSRMATRSPARKARPAPPECPEGIEWKVWMHPLPAVPSNYSSAWRRDGRQRIGRGPPPARRCAGPPTRGPVR